MPCTLAACHGYCSTVSEGRKKDVLAVAGTVAAAMRSNPEGAEITNTDLIPAVDNIAGHLLALTHNIA